MITPNVEDYKIVEDTDSDRVETAVKKLIAEGYVLYGPITAVPINHWSKYTQVMVKLKSSTKAQVKEQ